MKIETLPASKGDCFLITWNEEGQEYSILIDTGIKGTYKHIKEKLKGIINLKGVFITHVDYDHIGGMLKMIDDNNCPVDMKHVTVYINTPELIIGNNDDDKVHYGHGTSLETSLNKRGVQKKAICKDIAPNNKYKIGSLEITILSPTLEILEELKSKWTKEKIYQEYLVKSKVDDKVCVESSSLKSYDEIINEEEMLHKWTDDLVNASSMAFIIEANDKKILFLGDSNPVIVKSSLEELGYNRTNKLEVDMVKVSHHGSRYNTSKDLLESIDCKDYIISTNGKGPYNHPHRETIVKMSEFSRSNKTTSLKIYTNYDLELDVLLTKSEQANLNINIEKRNEFTLS